MTTDYYGGREEKRKKKRKEKTGNMTSGNWDILMWEKQ